MKTWEVKANLVGMGTIVVEAGTLQEAEDMVMLMTTERLVLEMDFENGLDIIDTQEV